MPDSGYGSFETWEELCGIRESDQLLGDAICIARRSAGANRANLQQAAKEAPGRLELAASIRSQEEIDLKDFALKGGILQSPDQFESSWITQGRFAGGEHMIIYSTDVPRIAIKRSNIPYHDTWADYFERVAIHKYIFPVTALSLVGFQEVTSRLRDDENHEWKTGLYAVIHQPFIQAERGATLDEISVVMRQQGFINVRPLDWYHPIHGIHANDLHCDNAVMTRNEKGDLDCVILDPLLHFTRASMLDDRIKAFSKKASVVP